MSEKKERNSSISQLVLKSIKLVPLDSIDGESSEQAKNVPSSDEYLKVSKIN